MDCAWKFIFQTFPQIYFQVFTNLFLCSDQHAPVTWAPLFLVTFHFSCSKYNHNHASKSYWMFYSQNHHKLFFITSAIRQSFNPIDSVELLAAIFHGYSKGKMRIKNSLKLMNKIRTVPQLCCSLWLLTVVWGGIVSCQHRAWPGATETLLSHLISATQSSTKRVKLGQIGHILVRMEREFTAYILSLYLWFTPLHCTISLVHVHKRESSKKEFFYFELDNKMF